MAESNPDQEFQAFVAQYGLTIPTPIKWDRKVHRFKSTGEKGKHRDGAAWYRAFPDQTGAVFGCFKLGLDSVTWQAKNAKDQTLDAEGWKKLQAEWREQEKQRKAEQEAQWAETAAKLQKVWDAAKPAKDSHPYLTKKCIVPSSSPEWYAQVVRQVGDTLLIPLRGPLPGSGISSIQYIDPEGGKLYAEGSRVEGTACTLLWGQWDKRGTYYLCEGWATGVSICLAMQRPVFIAFSANNLVPVARHLGEAYPQADLIIAADNDRWTHRQYPEGRKVANPGVCYATEAKMAAGEDRASVAIPDFDSLQDKPTDFNDLSLREGWKKERYWLNPAHAELATIVAEGNAANAPEPEPEPDPQPVRSDAWKDGHPDEPWPEDHAPVVVTPEEVPEELPVEQGVAWEDTAPFRCAGYDSGIYFYLPEGTGQVVGLGPSSHRRENLLSLAPLSWWEEHFPAKNGAEWHVAADACFRACERVGVFRPERLRGRGCWHEGLDGVVLHLGDRLLPPESRQYVRPERFRDQYNRIYERLPRLTGPAEDRAATLAEAQEILHLCTDLLWMEDASGYLLGGWIVLAPICGAIPWRPHIWVTGGAGAGKSEVLKKLVVPMLGGAQAEHGMSFFYEGGSTEAGIRQQLKADALPVVYDESEKEATGSRSDQRVQSVLALARSASSRSGSMVAKGTTYGQSQTYQISSMFCLASISSGVRQEQDKQRISVLQLHSRGSIDREVRQAHWSTYEPRLRKVKPTTGRRLIARTVSWLRDGRLDQTLDTFRGAAAHVLGDARTGDQYGTLYGGAWTLMADEPPTDLEARELVGSTNLSTYIAEQFPEGEKVLASLMQREGRVEIPGAQPKTMRVGEMVDFAEKYPDPTSLLLPDSEVAKVKAVHDWMRQHGLLVKLDEEQGALLYIATRSEWVRDSLRDTPYADNWKDSLKAIRAVDVAGPSVYFYRGLQSRTVVVPLVVLS